MSAFIYDTSEYRRSLLGMIVEEIDDPEKAKLLCDAVVSYGNACRSEGLNKLDREFRNTFAKVREEYE